MENAWQPADDPDGDEPAVRPLVLALALATGYALLCGSYIVLSGRAVAERASDVGDLAHMEQLKGLGFVASTALVFFAFAWFLLRRLAARMPLGVVTGRPRRDAERWLRDHDLASLFRAVVCLEDGPPKPDPRTVEVALQRLDVAHAWLVGELH